MKTEYGLLAAVGVFFIMIGGLLFSGTQNTPRLGSGIVASIFAISGVIMMIVGLSKVLS